VRAIEARGGRGKVLKGLKRGQTISEEREREREMITLEWGNSAGRD
jgi:hypothetical protein